jgi:hypothetical protein
LNGRRSKSLVRHNIRDIYIGKVPLFIGAFPFFVERIVTHTVINAINKLSKLKLENKKLIMEETCGDKNILLVYEIIREPREFSYLKR